MLYIHQKINPCFRRILLWYRLSLSQIQTAVLETGRRTGIFREPKTAFAIQSWTECSWHPILWLKIPVGEMNTSKLSMYYSVVNSYTFEVMKLCFIYPFSIMLWGRNTQIRLLALLKTKLLCCCCRFTTQNMYSALWCTTTKSRDFYKTIWNWE